MKRLLPLLILCGLALAASPAFSQTSLKDYGLTAKQRFALGARAEYVWWQGDIAEAYIKPDKEWAGGLVGAYRMVPNVSLSARFLYHVDSKLTSFGLGISVSLWDGWDQQ